MTPFKRKPQPDVCVFTNYYIYDFKRENLIFAKQNFLIIFLLIIYLPIPIYLNNVAFFYNRKHVNHACGSKRVSVKKTITPDMIFCQFYKNLFFVPYICRGCQTYIFIECYNGTPRNRLCTEFYE